MGHVWFLGRTKYLVGRTNQWVANPPGPGQTSALQIKVRSGGNVKTQKMGNFLGKRVKSLFLETKNFPSDIFMKNSSLRA